jgi:mannose-6-phosphate isomerase-like protein (cupin superfamily)
MQRIKNLSDIPAFRAADGTRLREVIHPANDSVSLPYSLAHASLNPGERSLPHILDNDEVYAFRSGEGALRRSSGGAKYRRCPIGILLYRRTALELRL